MRPKNPMPVSIDIARARLVVAAVAMDFGVPEASINCPNKGASDICYARQVAMYLMNCVYGVTKTRIADVFMALRKPALRMCLDAIFQQYRMLACVSKPSVTILS